MTRSVALVSPENVRITYRLAGVTPRFMALVVDLCIQLTLILALQMATGVVTGAIRAVATLDEIVVAAYIVGAYSILFAYATFFEMLWGGRTPGKRLFGLRVIRDGGYGIDLSSSAMRNVLRFVDFGIAPPALVLFGMPGLVTMLVSPANKRIGDYAAGTLVIQDAGVSPYRTDTVRPEGADPSSRFLSVVRNIDRVTLDEYRVIRRFLARRAQLEITVQAALGQRIAEPLIRKLEMRAPVSIQLDYADILAAIERRYSDEYGAL